MKGWNIKLVSSVILQINDWIIDRIHDRKNISQNTFKLMAVLLSQ